MVLSEQDAALFYELWFPLLEYVNQNYKVSENLKQIAVAESLDPAEVKLVANYLWDNPGIIDDYLHLHGDLPKDHAELIQSWKRCVKGRFVLERHLKKGSIFISTDHPGVYQVCGIITSLEEMFYWRPLPILMDVALIPFRDVIISDGLLVPLNVYLGGGIKRMLKETYMTAKKEGTIHRTLQDRQWVP